jgi:hypothetical protein
MMRILFKIAFLFCAIPMFAGSTPKEYIKNNHVKFEIEILNENFVIHYTFKDQFEKLREFTITMPVKKTVNDIARFGVPRDLYKPYFLKKSVLKRRNKIISKGLFKQTNDVLKPDYIAIAQYYKSYTQSIAGSFIQILVKEKKDSPKNRIEMAMKFVQDIPYGVPEISDTTWETGGLFTPPEVLIRMYGDCDSKAVLFASLIGNLFDEAEMLFLFTSNKHALTAIKGIPEKGQSYVQVGTDKYIITDVSGPKRLAFGDEGNDTILKTAYKIEKLALLMK